MDKNKETFETWNNIATLYQDKFMDLDLYNDTYDFICSAIEKPKAKLLEIGCGPGNITRYLLNKRPDFNIFGIDIAPNMIVLAKQNNPTADFVVMDSREIHKLEEKYDSIIVGFCLPYLSQEESDTFIENSYALLLDKGLIYLSFVEGHPDQSEYKGGSGGRVFFNYHDLNHIHNQLKACKFADIKTFKVSYPTSESTFDVHTIVMARKFV